jgi:hypothetical protein
MKRTFQAIFTSALIILLVSVFAPLSAQEPPHPPTVGHGAQGNQTPGNSAPIQGGIGILITLGIAYGARKLFMKDNTAKEE